MKRRFARIIKISVFAFAATYLSMSGSNATDLPIGQVNGRAPMTYGAGMAGMHSDHSHDEQDSRGSEQSPAMMRAIAGDLVSFYEKLMHHAGMLNLSPEEGNSLKIAQASLTPKLKAAAEKLAAEYERLAQMLADPAFEVSKVKAQLRVVADARTRQEAIALEGIIAVRDALTNEHYSRAIEMVTAMAKSGQPEEGKTLGAGSRKSQSPEGHKH